MSMSLRTALAAALLVPLSLAPGAAHAAAPDPITDSGCGFTAVTDPNPEAPADTQTGYLYGGPIAQNGTLTCTIKVGVDTHSGAYVNGASASATGTNGVTVVAPTIVSYVAPPEIPVYFCDQFRDAGGTTYYWDGDLNVWTTSSAVHCELAISGDGTAVGFGGAERAPRDYYPKGTIEISYTPGTGTVTVQTGFDPPVLGWVCNRSVSPSLVTVSCTPPAPPRPLRNVCSALTVQTTNVLGSVTGRSACYSGAASATAGLPAVSAAGTATPFSAFPWTCSATPNAAAVGPWKVRCSVGS